MRWQNKVAVVTDGAQGIGRAAVEKFQVEGAKVALLDIEAARGAAAEATLGGPEAGIVLLRCDITKEREVAAAMAATVERCGTLDIPHIRQQGGGSIVNIASIHAFMTTYGVLPYAAAKSDLVGMTRGMALDFGPEQIRINATCPGWVRTQLVDEWPQRQPESAAAEQQVLDQQLLRRMATPMEIANVISFVGSDEADFITGAALLIDGGLSARFAT